MQLTPKTEDQEQTSVVDYLEILQQQGKILKYSALAQNTWTSSWSQKAKNKRTGVRKGVPDLLVVYPNDILFLEMKKEKGGVVSKDQKEWIDALKQANTNISVCRGFKEAKLIIDLYL